MEWGGLVPPPLRESADQSSDQAVPLADGIGIDEPLIPLAVAEAPCVDDAIPLHVHHDGVDGALMAAWIQSHAPHNVGAGLGTVLNQGGADCGADQSGEVHWSGVVN